MSEAGTDTIARLRSLIAASCEISPDLVVPQARLRGYGIDSIRIMDLMLTIEEQFAVRFNVEELDGVRTVGELAAYIERLRQQTPDGKDAAHRAPHD
jgi:acyl carrier protein